MSHQIELFNPLTPANYYPLNHSWYIEVSKCSTADYQHIIFMCDDLPSSKWLINALDEEVLYLSGDQSREPNFELVREASRVLIEMTKSGLLFPKPLNEVIYTHAWGKGYEAGFNQKPKTKNL
jgi:hypothetical protein